ncbi:Double C2-like domain-containing protein gamma [Bos mutus]|uniref:Double C2-like domain-containing protein gamma n=1 Tax=Bos mutus TaxID=72004 RepID=L8I3P5_9CETA|nr:Double C2-like domain-containing protein gamma [Bos mutus]
MAGRGRVSMQEHMAIDVSPGPIRPIRLISHYFPHFYPTAEPALHPPDPRPPVTPVHSAPQPQLDPEPEGDSDDSTALGTLEFTLLFDTDNSTLHCTAHRAKGLKPPASGSMDTFVKANLLPGASKASQLRTRTVRGMRGPVWEETLTYHGFTLQDARRKTLRPRGPRAWTQHAACLCMRSVRRGTQRWVLGRALGPGELRETEAFSLSGPMNTHSLRGIGQLETEAGAGQLVSGLHGRFSSQYGVGGFGGSSECPRGSPLWGHTETNLISPSFLHPNTGRKSKYKTSVRKKTLNPEFNEEFFYAGPREELAQKTLLVSVWDYDLGTADDFIGGVQLSSRAGGERQQHWRECLGHSDRRLELWHPLDGAPLQLSD